MKRFLPLYGLLAALLAGNSQAIEYTQLSSRESSMTFAYRQMGVPMQGKFGQFAARLNFDPEHLTQAKAQIDVTLSSIDTGSADADAEVAGKLWFNTKVYPEARFVASSIQSLGGNRYQAQGRLSIKGRTLDIVAPVTFKANGNKASFDGAFAIRRSAFAIGEGEWRDFNTVADDIQIVFHLVVQASPH